MINMVRDLRDAVGNARFWLSLSLHDLKGIPLDVWQTRFSAARFPLIGC